MRFVSLFDDETIRRFWSNVSIGLREQCWEWKGTRRAWGYGAFHANGKNWTAHRLALFFATPDELVNDKAFACHHCDNPSCCNPTHLYWGDVVSNNRDMKLRGRYVGNKGHHASGEQSSQAKLTEHQVREIRALHATGKVSYKELGRRFGVSNIAIRYICKRQSWKHVA